MLAGLFWAWAADEDIIQRLVKRTLYIGFFAFVIDHFSGLSGIVFNSFAALGLKAGGGTLALGDFMHPGRLAATGLDAAQPLLDAASKLAFSFGALASIVQILVLLLCWFIVLAAFFRGHGGQPLKRSRLLLQKTNDCSRGRWAALTVPGRAIREVGKPVPVDDFHYSDPLPDGSGQKAQPGIRQ
ncbi:MAG: type IV secretion system protein [Gluconobacter potus]